MENKPTEGAIIGREDSNEAPIVCFKFSPLSVAQSLPCPSAYSISEIVLSQQSSLCRHNCTSKSGKWLFCVEEEGCSSAVVLVPWDGVSSLATRSSQSQTRDLSQWVGMLVNNQCTDTLTRC